MLTNWGTISNSIKKLKKLETDLVSENRGFTKKELLKIRHPLDEQFDEFIDQESLRKVVIAFEDRVGYTHNANRFDYLLEHDPEEQKERAEAEANRNEELAEADVVAGSL